MIQVIDRVFDILEFLSLDPDKEQSLARIAEETSIQKTTAANILKSLSERGYVSHSVKMKGYRLGYKASSLALNSGFFDKLTEIATAEAKSLFEAFSETGVIATENRDRRVILGTLECQTGITARISHSPDLYKSATGRVMLAFYPEEKSSAIIGRTGLPESPVWEGVDSPGRLSDELRKIRGEGYSVRFDSSEIVGIAVPVFLRDSLVASIGICLPEYRCNPVKITLMVEGLNNCSSRISRRLELIF